MARPTISVAGEIAAVATALTGRLPQLGDELLERLLAEIPELRSDPTVQELLAASARENIATGTDVLAHGIDVATVEPPAAAAEYARRIAQRGVPVEAMLRAYRIGHLCFLEWWLGEISARGLETPEAVAALDQVVRRSFRYIDRMSEQLIGVYVGERNRWLQSASSGRAALVRGLLAGEVGDLGRAEAVLNYRLRQSHLGLVAWLEPAPEIGEGPAVLDRVASALVAGCPSPPLIVIVDAATLWAWLPASGLAPTADAPLASAIQDAADGVRAGVGVPAEGVEGFRTTHEQALRARAVAAAAGGVGPVVTSFRDASLISFLTSDLAAARGWVTGVLGPLAADEEAAARLRDTVRVFLETKGSYLETAARLHLHKNTVHYRVRKAEEMRGRPLDDDRVGVEVALLACDRLGSVVLIAPAL